MLTPLRSAVLALLLAFQLLLPACADASRPLGLGLNHHRGGILGGGQIGGGIAGVTYDASFGTGTDASGFATLPLRSGAVRIFVNSSTGSDSNTCTQAQSAATPKATFKNAFDNCVVDGEGDQVLLAQGTSYPRGLARMRLKGGFSIAYPLVVQSYDPADPTNEAKIGRATGSARPVIDLTGVDMGGTYLLSPDAGDTVKSNYAFRGLEFNSGNVPDVTLGVAWSAASGAFNDILFENNVFAYYMVSFASNDPVVAQHIVLRHNAFYGEWSSSSYQQGLYIDQVDGPIAEDNVFWHAGWKIGAARGDAPSSGGAQIFAHAIYTQQGVFNAVARRNVFIDNSADAGELKGGGIYQGNLSLNNPIGPFLGFHENVYSTLAPLGVYIDGSFNAVLGSDGNQNWGVEVANGKTFSLARYNVVAQVNTSNGFWGYGLMTDAGADAYDVALPSYMTWDHNVNFNWGNHSGYGSAAPCLHTDAGKCNGTYIIPTYTNNRWDDATSGTNTNVTGGFANAYTPTTLATALGYVSLTTAQADWVAHPDQHAWRAGTALVLTGYGVTLPTTSDLATDMRITAGLANAGQFIGTLDGSVLTSSDLPACVTLDSSARAWRATSACTAQSATVHVTETPPTGPPHTTAIALNVYARPTLSTISVTPGSTTATWTGTPSVGSGNLYYNVASTSFTGAWQFVRASHHGAGLDYISGTVVGGSQAVAATTPQSIVASGLTASTAYYFNVAQLDANNNPTLTSSTAFTTTSAAWSPTSLGAALKAWYDPSDLTTMFQDAAGTTAVTTDGQSVCRINDKSGNSNFLSQATTANCPIYHTSGGKKWLDFNGTSQTLSTPSTFAATDGTGQHALAVSAYFNNNSGTYVIAHLQGALSTDVSWVFNGSGTSTMTTWNNAASSTNDTGAAITAATGVVLLYTVTPTAAEVYVDNSSGGATSLTGTRASPAAGLSVGSTWNPSFFTPGRVYGLVEIAGTVSSTDRGNLQTYLAALH